MRSPCVKLATAMVIRDPDEKEHLVDEARRQHYQDQPLLTSALTGGVIGAAIPSALTAFSQGRAGFNDPGQLAATSVLSGGIGAASGVGIEALGRVLTRLAGPTFNPRRFYRDQDPHRLNSALKVAPLGVSLLGSKFLLPWLLEQRAKQASAAPVMPPQQPPIMPAAPAAPTTTPATPGLATKPPPLPPNYFQYKPPVGIAGARG